MPGHCKFMPLNIMYSIRCNSLVEKWRDKEKLLALDLKDILSAWCAGYRCYSQWRTSNPPPIAVRASAVAHMVRRYSSTQWSITSVKPMNLLLCHPPLHSFLPSFPSPSLASFLPLFSFRPRRQKTLSDHSTAVSWVSAVWHCTVQIFHVPANRIVLYLPTLQTKSWQQPTVWGHWAIQCSSPPGLHIPKTYFWTKMPRFPAYSPPTMNSLTLGYIPYTGKLLCRGTAIAIQNIPQTQGKGMEEVISPLSHTWLYHSKAKGASLYLMHAPLGIHYCLELLTCRQYQGPNNNTAFESLKFSSMF